MPPSKLPFGTQKMRRIQLRKWVENVYVTFLLLLEFLRTDKEKKQNRIANKSYISSFSRIIFLLFWAGLDRITFGCLQNWSRRHLSGINDCVYWFVLMFEWNDVHRTEWWKNKETCTRLLLLMQNCHCQKINSK